MEWPHSVSPRLKEFRVQKFAGKFLASPRFLDQDSILLIDYLPKCQSGVLLISAGTIKRHFEGKTPRRGKVTKEAFFLHDNASAQWALPTPKNTGLPGLPIS
jgi:hypothetical protein